MASKASAWGWPSIESMKSLMACLVGVNGTRGRVSPDDEEAGSTDSLVAVVDSGMKSDRDGEFAVVRLGESILAQMNLAVLLTSSVVVLFAGSYLDLSLT